MKLPPFPHPFRADLLLVFPPFDRAVVSMENVGIESIAACARARGFTVGLLNAGLHGLTEADVQRAVREARFRALGISTLHWTLPAALRIAAAAKRFHPDCHVILGGVEAALTAERLLQAHPFIDSVAQGEGEETVSELLQCLADGGEWREIAGLAWRDGARTALNPPRRLIDPLDRLPFPARDDLAAVLDSGGAVCISSSRGCPGRCAFCSVRSFYRLSEGASWRGRSPESVVEEIRALQRDRGVRLFSFIDETVLGPGPEGRERLSALARRLRQLPAPVQFFMTFRAEQVERELFAELAEAGLRKVELGIESMSATQLRRYGKMAAPADNRRALRTLDELGIACEMFLIPYDPLTTRRELECNLRFCAGRWRRPSGGYDVAPLGLANYLYPYPGTRARALYRRKRWLAAGHLQPFRAEDAVIEKTQRLVQLFIQECAAAFPMSYLGLGNLWVNGAGLSEPLRRRICRHTTAFGGRVVQLARWSLRTCALPQPMTAARRRRTLAELEHFIGAALKEQNRLRRLTRRIRRAPLAERAEQFPSRSAAMLHRFGRARRSQFVQASLSYRPNKRRLAQALLALVEQ